MGIFRSRITKLKLINTLLIAITIGIIFAFVGTVGLFAWYSKDLPRPDKVRRVEGLSTVLTDRNGEVLYDIFSDQNRVPVTLADIPDTLKKATISIEDKDFYKHQGFDPKGIIRAFINILTLHGMQGGSTLTQQLVKNALLTGERTLPRKIKEFILAVQIERKYSKDEIIQMYLNEAPYGTYFGKHAKELNLTESAILAGLPQSPSYYSPFGPSPKSYIWRTQQVLRRMREDGYITPREEQDANKALPNYQFAKGEQRFKAPHFVMYVKQMLIDKFGEKMVEQGGLKVTTTLDYKIQEKAETIVKEEIEKLKSLKVSNGALVVIDPKTGEILSLIGSKDYFSDEKDFQGKFDVATLGLRQPGSALKPITYAVGLNKGYTASSLFMDVETKFPGGKDLKDYIPKNYDNKFRGPVQMRFALASSINVPAVKMTALVGIKDILKTAFDMGLSTLSPTDENINRFGLSVTLGGGEVKLINLTSAYGVFATGGIYHEPVSILEVKDKDSKTIFKNQTQTGKKVLGEDVSFIISQILQDNNSRKEVFGPNSYLVVPGKTVAVKTGTTDDKKDNWTVGYTPSVVAGVWVGNNDNTSMNPAFASGVTGAAPIWNRVMKEILKDKKDEEFKKPDNVTNLDIDSYGGGLPKDGQSTRKEFYIKGTEPTSTSPIYKKIKLFEGDNNKLANPLQIVMGQYDEKEFIVFTEKDPTSGDGTNRWQEGIDAWVNSLGDSKYHPPRDTSTNDQDSVVVSIKNPSDHSKQDSHDLKVEARAVSAGNIDKMELRVDNNLKNTYSGNSFSDTINLDTGKHSINIKAYDNRGKSGDSTINIGIGMDWDYNPVPTSPPAPTSTPTPILTIIPSITPI
ncbi:MAG: Penicillin-binding protein, 1A family [Candidatus Gottesmanbacteria bacterium GW2011_GWC2_39_8]|uniref:peptidoglycan glycosyltransferase n=1 Tax=Candidatus Gottesmanbacteria bacterium GW2011_GWC2_39_8 TaxID=1618450 RepID=A0A0G0T1G3_9BACT|nr:MAG: Penicillin-binding protein, 1A family [Candidatus Gottesmanbacteria bacterium GW2011_GWC2_39_8]